MAYRSIVQRRIIYALALTSLAACSTINSMLEPDRINYRSADMGKKPTLEVPPDLTQLQADSRYALPDSGKGTATASAYQQQLGARPVAGTAVAPNSVRDMHVERAGNQRWLVVKQAPESLWPQLKDFWQDAGFQIKTDLPQAGVMETDWAENRAKIPQDFIRNSIGKVFDSLYSTGERDKFRTRLERATDGSTEIYISHRGAQELVTGAQKDSTVWTPRAPDPELEAEFLARLMVRLGGETLTVAKTAVAAAAPQPLHAKLLKGAEGNYVELDEGFDRAWRRVGLVLDRAGFTVEDKDRSKGTYYVRYLDQKTDANGDAIEPGFFAKLFSGKSEKDKAAQRYRVLVKDSGIQSKVSVQNDSGATEVSTTSDKILALLNDQLK